MKPEDYQRYAFSIDLLSDPALNDGIRRFIELVVCCLPPSAKICDIGGGTGYLLNLILKKRQDLSATLIEPAQPMYRQAEFQRVPQVTLINTTLQDSLPSLPLHHAFLFCRSLYPIFSKIKDYKTLFFQLAATLQPLGQLYIFEPNRVYDIPAYKKGLEAQLSEKQAIFNRHWPVLELALQRFNDGVTKGEFTLFSTDQLTTLGQQTGFELLYHRSPNLYRFRKHYKSSRQSLPSKSL